VSLMRESHSSVVASDRVALLRHGIAVVAADTAQGRLRVGVTGAGSARVREVVARRLGADADVEVLGDLPRRLQPRECSGYMEREPGRLQLRFGLCGDEHVDDIVVAEDGWTVVVFATVCTSVSGEVGAVHEGPWHVHLERPLGDRAVIDGTSGNSVPYKNVYAGLESAQT
jgi:hypothetical protein